MDSNKYNFSVSLDPNSCFDVLDSSNPYKHISIAISILSTLLCTPALYSIIWFEKFDSDHHRTIINRIVSSLCWNGIVWLGLVQSLFTIRFAAGPLPSWVCFGQFVAKKIVVMDFIMLLNASTLFRYIFVLWLKNPAAFNDDFWHIFINMWVVSFSFVYQIPRAIIPSNQLLEYKICTGENPTSILPIPPLIKPYIELSGIFLQVFVYIKISLFKRKRKTKVEPVSQAKLWKNTFISDIEKTSIAGFISNSISFFLIGLGAALAILRTFQDCLDFQTSLKYLMFYFLDLVLPFLSCLCVVVAYYRKKSNMLKTIFEEFKEFLHSLKY